MTALQILEHTADIVDERRKAYGPPDAIMTAIAARWSLTPGRHPNQGFGPWLAGALLSLWTLLLYGRWISDTLTAYKLYPAPFIKSLKLETSGFETDHEITARLIRAGFKIAEVPIAYHPRSTTEGKKIKPSDGLIAVWTLLKFRFK